MVFCVEVRFRVRGSVVVLLFLPLTLVPLLHLLSQHKLLPHVLLLLRGDLVEYFVVLVSGRDAREGGWEGGE